VFNSATSIEQTSNLSGSPLAIYIDIPSASNFVHGSYSWRIGKDFIFTGSTLDISFTETINTNLAGWQGTVHFPDYLSFMNQLRGIEVGGDFILQSYNLNTNYTITNTDNSAGDTWSGRGFQFIIRGDFIIDNPRYIPIDGAVALNITTDFVGWIDVTGGGNNMPQPPYISLSPITVYGDFVLHTEATATNFDGFNANFTVFGNLDVKTRKEPEYTGVTPFGNDGLFFDVWGNAVIDAKGFLGKYIYVHGDLTSSGTVQSSQFTWVGGNTVITGDYISYLCIQNQGNANITGNISVTAGNFNSDNSVATIVTGNAIVAGGFMVNGNINVDGDLTTGGNYHWCGTETIGGTKTIGGVETTC